MAIMKRVARALRAIVVAINQLIGTTITALLYIVGFAPEPNPDEAISSIVGRNAQAGKWWARVLEKVIDLLLWLLGDGWGHCRRSIEWTEWPR